MKYNRKYNSNKIYRSDPEPYTSIGVSPSKESFTLENMFKNLLSYHYNESKDSYLYGHWHSRLTFSFPTREVTSLGYRHHLHLFRSGS